MGADNLACPDGRNDGKHPPPNNILINRGRKILTIYKPKNVDRSLLRAQGKSLEKRDSFDQRPGTTY